MLRGQQTAIARTASGHDEFLGKPNLLVAACGARRKWETREPTVSVPWLARAPSSWADMRICAAAPVLSVAAGTYECAAAHVDQLHHLWLVSAV
jgi:hypothetical protein